MNRDLAQKVANAVLYEGYMLYPYRPSAIKNRQRWTFGILYPPAYDEVNRGTERSAMHSEVLVRASGEASIYVQLRFLHLVSRQVADAGDEPVASVVVDGRLVETWDEGVERSVEFEGKSGGAPSAPVQFSFPSGYESEPLRNQVDQVVGSLNRTQREVSGTVSVSFAPLRDNVLKFSIDVTNTTPLTADSLDRNSALLQSLLSAHTILTVTGGEFVSLLDPADELRELIAGCKNIGNFPVLAGDAGERDMMLCSPIVLYDYPQIAPESAGDFFDGTEMDEMLTLRVMTLTDEEKDEMRFGDDRARNLLERTQASARDQLMRTHGTIRSMRPVSEES